MRDSAFTENSCHTRSWKFRVFIILCATLVVLVMVTNHDFLTSGRVNIMTISAGFLKISPPSVSKNVEWFLGNLSGKFISDYPKKHSRNNTHFNGTYAHQELNVSKSDSQKPDISDKDLKKLNLTKSQYLRYLKLREDYKVRLTAIPRHHYGSSEKYIQYGKPMKALRPNTTAGPKRILAWTGFFRRNWMSTNITCAGGERCIGSTNRGELMESDAVVMHSRDLRVPENLPKTRNSHQIWVYYAMESPYHIGIRPKRYSNVFNWTATFRRDSDIFSPYFSFVERKTKLTDAQYNRELKNIMDNKTKHLVAHVASNCRARHTNRLSYIKEMRRYIPVDMYGRCGTSKCERFSAECNHTLSSYKFYLSMENSHCRDYITEKVEEPLFFWKAVPIVMGADDPGNYAEILPPDSYIHTSGFKSPKELVEYLLLLDKSPALYQKYHRWRISYERRIENGFFPWCQICRKLQDASLPSQVYKDFEGWYREDTCK